MRSILAITTLLSALVLPSVAAADENTEERLTPSPLASSPPSRRYYGWQILASDAATVVTSAVLNSGDAQTLAQANFAAGYLLAGPIIHAAHGNVGTAFGSLALRAGMPVAAALGGCALFGRNDDEWGCLGGVVLGTMVGVGGAIAIDTAALGYADERPRPKTFEVLPSANVSRTGATFGLQGIF